MVGDSSGVVVATAGSGSGGKRDGGRRGGGEKGGRRAIRGNSRIMGWPRAMETCGGQK